jgi:gas vesicle structural protein
MAVERTPGGTSLIDVLDRVLDKGIVIDAWVRVSLVGIDLITVEARVVVASIDTYLKYSEAVSQVLPASRPPAELTQNVMAENAALRAELAAKNAKNAKNNAGRIVERVTTTTRVRPTVSSKQGTRRARRRRTQSRRTES